jgi:UPF0042 nucleotide-binding protein
MNPLRIVVVTGMSGSGKTTAAHALEDAGFFCIDNLPPALIGRLTDLLIQSGGEVTRVALVVDVREGKYLKDLPATLETLRTEGCRVEVLFLDSGDDVLARRFTETRRRHPLAAKGTVEDGIREERALLEPLRGLSDRVIDTSAMTVHDLRKVVEEFVGDAGVAGTMSVAVISFGFRYGLPVQCDLVFDARFLPNPFYVPKFKGMTGSAPAVADFVLSNADGREFVARVMDLLGFLIPRFMAEGKVYLNVGIGCTGGRHRSVAIAEELKQRLTESGVAAVCRHRDIDRS